MTLRRFIPTFLLTAALLAGCVRSWSGNGVSLPARGGGDDFTQAFLAPTLAALGTPAPKAAGPSQPGQNSAPAVLPTRAPTLAHTGPAVSPTPDQPHALPTLRSQPTTYVVQSGDTLALIAQRNQISLQALLVANSLANPNLLYVGTALTIPAPSPDDSGSSFKVIPDSELVYGPKAADFDTVGFIQSYNGLLASYQEKVDDVETGGPQIVDRIAHEFSVNPRLLIAVLEYQSHWLTEGNPTVTPRGYPMGYQDPAHTGLYRQLSWTADNLNRGFYLWQAGGLAVLSMASGEVVPAAATINAGTAGVQYFFALLNDRAGWLSAVSGDGLFKTYQGLFGSPFDYAFEPLLPADLAQPKLQLPFEDGVPWSFTGGPHGGWAEGSAWAAVDFAPPGDSYGCYTSPAWAAAAADGVIVRSGTGAVVEDLDGDGKEQTGWTILYMHMATADRIAVGTHVKAGDRIGHPSCEGGVSNGTHMHFARRYNGVWIAADGPIPFNLDGWVSSGDGIEYDGYLQKNGESIEAWDGRAPANQIQR